MASETPVWTPTATIEELYSKMGEQKFSAINKPTSGAQTEKELEEGPAQLQYYSLATPNGQKPAILLEELGVEYDAHYINIMEGAQFTSGFVAVCPNSKIPGLVDKDGPGGKPINIWESASIMLYLAEKYNKFIPSDPALKVEMMNWIFWQMAGQGPITGGGFGHFYAYAPADKIEARNYGVARYGMDVQRMCHLLDTHLAGKDYMIGNEYGLADMCLFPWARVIVKEGYKANGIPCKDFLQADKYKNIIAWVERIEERPAVKRGLTVCSKGVGKPWLNEKEEAAPASGQ